MSGTNGYRYPGPNEFEDTPADQALFSGRDEEIHAITQQIIASRLVVLYGSSGLGKSSLLKAGVFPKLRDSGFCPIRVRITDRISVLELLAESCEKASRELGLDYTPGIGSTAWEFCKTLMFWRGSTLLQPVLVFDQFEEIFTRVTSEWREEFGREIGALASNNLPESVRNRLEQGEQGLTDLPPRVKLIFSIREEFYGSLQELSADFPALFQDRFRLLPMDRSRAELAIRQPALMDSTDSLTFVTPPFAYADETVAAMLHFLASEYGTIEPFQLQLLCQHIERAIVPAKRPPVEITPDDLGGKRAMSGLIHRFFTDSIAQLPGLQARRARELCDSGLLSSDGHRLMLQKTEILRNYKISELTLKHLIDKHILREEPRLDSLFYEIGHDAIARSIFESRPWRLPQRWRLAAGVGVPLLLGLLIAGVWFTAKLKLEKQDSDNLRFEAIKARKEADQHISFLIGEDLLTKIRPMGKLDVLKGIQNEVRCDKSDQGLSGEELHSLGLGCLNDGDVKYSQYKIEEARKSYDRAKTLFSRNPQWRWDLAYSLSKLADVADSQWHFDTSLQFSKQSLSIQESLLGETSSEKKDSLQRYIAQNYLRVGEDEQKRGNFGAARDAYQHALDLAARNESVEWLYIRQDILIGQGDLFAKEGNLKAEERMYREAKKLADEAEKDSPFSPEARHRVGVALVKIADLPSHKGDEELLKQYIDVHEQIKAVADWEPENKVWQNDLAGTYLRLGIMYVARKEWNQATKHLGEGSQILERLSERDDTNRELKEGLADLHFVRGIILSAASSLGGPSALEKRMEIVKLQSSPSPFNSKGGTPEHSEDSKSVSAPGRARASALSEYDEARRIYESLQPLDPAFAGAREGLIEVAVQECQESPKVDSCKEAVAGIDWLLVVRPNSASQWDDKFDLYYKGVSQLPDTTRDRAAALAAYSTALEAAKRAVHLDAQNSGYRQDVVLAQGRIGEVLEELGDDQVQKGRLVPAENYYLRARQAFTTTIELADKKKVGYYRDQMFKLICDHIAQLREKQGDRAGMLNVYREALKLKEVTLEPNSADSQAEMATAYEHVGDQLEEQYPTEAAGFYRKAVESRRRAIKLDPKNVARWDALGKVLFLHLAPIAQKQGDRNAALQFSREALQTAEQMVALEPKTALHYFDLALAHEKVGEVFRDQGDLTQAERAYDQSEQAFHTAIALEPKSADYNVQLFLLLVDKVAPLHSADKSTALKTYERGTKAIGTVVVLEPKNAIYRSALASAHKMVGDQLQDLGLLADAQEAYKQAIASQQEAIRLEPKAEQWNGLATIFYNNLAPLSEKQNHTGEQIEFYKDALNATKKAAALEPQNAKYLSNLGYVYQAIANLHQEHGQSDQALEEYGRSQQAFQRAIQLKNDEEKYWFGLYLTSSSLGALHETQQSRAMAKREYNTAMEAIVKAAELEPTHSKYSDERATMEKKINALKTK